MTHLEEDLLESALPGHLLLHGEFAGEGELWAPRGAAVGRRRALTQRAVRETQRQHLHPRALQQVHLVVQHQIAETCPKGGGGRIEKGTGTENIREQLACMYFGPGSALTLYCCSFRIQRSAG